MERASPERVHLHAYLHLSKPFLRRGADALDKFEGSSPHVEPNRFLAVTWAKILKGLRGVIGWL